LKVGEDVLIATKCLRGKMLLIKIILILVVYVVLVVAFAKVFLVTTEEKPIDKNSLLK
jgi:hypothetical protein